MNMLIKMRHYFDTCHSIGILIRGPGNLLLTLPAADGMTNVVAECPMVAMNSVDARLVHKCKCRLYNCKDESRR